MAHPVSPVVRHLTAAQALYIGGTTVDLTLTGIVGARLAPTSALATLPFTIIYVTAGISTFFISRAIGRFGHRAVFTGFSCVAAVSGGVSAAAIQLGLFWLFCVGTGLIGIYGAGAGYYRYLAAESMPQARARAVTTVLAGGLIAALVGPFLATALSNVTPTPYVASYLLVAVLGTAAALWNRRLVVPAAASHPTPEEADSAAAQPRSLAVLWRQPTLLLGVACAVLAAGTMLAMMTAGPIMGMTVGHTSTEAALAIQLHLVGMYAPGFLVARLIARAGERLIALAGAALIVVAGIASAGSTALPAYLIAMCAVGVGWNLAYSSGSALISASYRPAERGRVQPVAEVLIISAQITGSLSAAAFTSPAGWHALGWGCLALAATVAVVLAVGQVRRSAGAALTR
jgi:MFS family permease